MRCLCSLPSLYHTLKQKRKRKIVKTTLLPNDGPMTTCKKILSCVLGLLTISLLIGYTFYVIVSAVNASRDATLQSVLGSNVQALAASLAEGSRGLRTAALAAKNAYTLEQMPPWNAGNDTRSLYLLSSIMALQQSYGTYLRYIYVSYKLPNSNMWGDLGCKVASANMGQSYQCYYVNTSGTEIYSNTANVSQVLGTNPFGDTSMYNYTKVIRGLTKGNISGYWHPPQTYFDERLNITVRLSSFTLPIEFDPVTGNCILAVTTDLDLGSGSAGVFGLTGFGTLGEMVALDGRGTGFMIGGSLETFFTNMPTQTTSPRINDLVQTFSAINSGNLLINGSFTKNGFNYQSSTIDNTFVLINRAPVVTSVQVTGSALKTTFDGVKLVAWTAVISLTEFMTNSMTPNPQKAMQYALNNPSQLISTSWFAMLQAFLGALFPKVPYVYLDYEYTLPNGTTAWGEAGSGFNYQSTTIDNYGSYIVSDNGILYSFTGLNLAAANASTPYFNQDTWWIANSRTLQKTDAAGKWLPLSAESVGHLYATFGIPLTFNASDYATSVVCADIDVLFLQQYLKNYKASGASQLAIIDTRGVSGNDSSPIVVASATATYNISGIFTARTLPDAAFGQLITRAALSAPGNNFSSLASFSYYDQPADSVVAISRVLGADLMDWAVVEVTPANVDTASFYKYSTCLNSCASDAAQSYDKLFTRSQKIGIPVYCGVIMFFILIDHIIILTFKTQVDGPKGELDAAMN